MSSKSSTKTTSKTSKTSKTSRNQKIICDNKIGISLCIPRVFNNIGWRRIKANMIACNWGFVERIDVIPCGTHKRAFVHFAPGKWNTRSSEAMAVLDAFQQGQQVQVVYDDPWFWKISASGSKKPAESPKPQSRPLVHINTDQEEKTPVDQNSQVIQLEEGEIMKEILSSEFEPIASQSDENITDQIPGTLDSSVASEVTAEIASRTQQEKKISPLAGQLH